MDDEAHIRLIREIEVEKGRMTAHELVCAQRWEAVHSTLAEIKTSLNANAGRTSKWKDRATYGLITLLFAFCAWSAAQLWNQEPLRVAHAEAPQR